MSVAMNASLVSESIDQIDSVNSWVNVNNFNLQNNLRIIDIETAPLTSKTTHIVDNQLISQNSPSEIGIDPKVKNFLYQLLLSSHDGKVLLKSYEHFKNKVESQSNENRKQKQKDDVEVEYESDDDSEFEDDDCEIICGDKDLSKYFSRRKLCDLIINYEINKNGYM